MTFHENAATTAQITEQMIYRRALTPAGGALFARAPEREKKDAARELILDLFDPIKWPTHLHMVTMPGAKWRFERLLLGRREPGWMRREKPQITSFCSIESDRSIFASACTQIPGIYTSTIRNARKFPFAEKVIKTNFASLFLANVDDFLTQEWGNGWSAAWLDYLGPITSSRLKLISNFYDKFISRILIITAMHGRWNKETSGEIAATGGYFEWLQSYLPGQVLHCIEYCDTAPMVQFAVQRNPLLLLKGEVK